MPQTPAVSIENNFTAGLKTEFTGLNFPENAAIDTDNCVYSLVGDVTRRLGFNYELNHALTIIDRTNKAISSYKWNNAGGDGLTQIVVMQVGNFLYFYRSSSATVTHPLSTTRLSSVVNLNNFLVAGTSHTIDATECQYTEGNGYLFVFHPYMDPIYCVYNAGTITATSIIVKIRDITGILEQGVLDTDRPFALTAEHSYNLQNQGWSLGAPWSADSTTTLTVSTGSKVFTIPSGLTIVNGTRVQVSGWVVQFDGAPENHYSPIMTGTVTGYSGTSLTLSISSVNAGLDGYLGGLGYSQGWQLRPANPGYVTTWQSAIGNYPSNGDVWWRFINSSGDFDPATTFEGTTLNSGPAPKGAFILDAFNQQRTLVSGTTGLTNVTTTIRPKTGAWFAGRIWYTGVDASFAATGDQIFSTWSESIYFSQVVKDTSNFGKCYDTNDPTSQTLFDILPTDGGVIRIQGCGSIYKLFPMQNGVLVFAANGVWWITGSSGIGFEANNYTVVRISDIQSISSTSFVSVQGLPFFWNEEGIYAVEQAEQGKGLLSNPLFVSPLKVNPITVGTILSFYASIPVGSKKFVRGSYNPLDYIIQWIYRSTDETDISSRYEFDSALNYNVYNKAFYPYTFTGPPHIHAVNYVAGPGGSTSPDPVFKYATSIVSPGKYSFTFSEERDDTYVDWVSNSTPTNYISYFVTGYKIHGQAQRMFQPGYVYVYSRNDVNTAYKIQGIWNFASDPNSGKYGSVQLVRNDIHKFDKVFRKHKIRGHGIVFQMKVSSVDGYPFDIMGWSMNETINAGV